MYFVYRNELRGNKQPQQQPVPATGTAERTMITLDAAQRRRRRRRRRRTYSSYWTKPEHVMDCYDYKT